MVTTPPFHCRGYGLQPWSRERRAAKKKKKKLSFTLCKLYLNKFNFKKKSC